MSALASLSKREKDRRRNKEAASAPVNLFRVDSLSPYIRGISQESLPTIQANVPSAACTARGDQQRGALLCHPPPHQSKELREVGDAGFVFVAEICSFRSADGQRDRPSFLGVGAVTDEMSSVTSRCDEPTQMRPLIAAVSRWVHNINNHDFNSSCPR